MMKFTKIFGLSLFIVSLFIITPAPSLSAQTSNLNLQDAFRTRDGELDCKDNDNLDCVADKAGFNVHSITTGGENDTIEPIIQNIINIVLSLLGIVFIAFIIYGGWEWFSARGNEQKLDRAKDTLTQAIIGLLIVLGSYAISYFVLNIFVPYLK